MTATRLCRVLLLMCLFVFGLGLALNAQAVIPVPAGQSTIQSAIDAAVNGDTILVSPGTYYERINFLGKSINVSSTGGAALTIIDGQNMGPVVTFSASETNASVISGFTIQHGCGQGGGIYVYFASPTITHNIVRNNNVGSCYGSEYMGGGIYLGGADTAQVLYNEIYGNDAEMGGGLEMWAAGNAEVDGNFIHDNTAEEGAGVDIENEGTSTVCDNVIVMNSGGGVYWGRMPGQFCNNTVAYNSTNGAPELSAVMWDGTFSNNLIVAMPGATAIECEAYAITASSFVHNDVYSNGGTTYSGCTAQTGSYYNTSADPLFADPANEDFHVATGSPVIGAASSSIVSLPQNDAGGDLRIVNGALDLGGYEYQGTTTMSVAPTGLTFASQILNSASAAQNVTVTNTGSQKLHFSPMQIGSDFLQSGICSGPNGLAVNASCTIAVAFKPLSRGTLTEALIVSGANGSGKSTVSLSGWGAAPVASLSAMTLNLGTQALFATSAAQPVTLTNVGDALMTVSSVATTGDFAVTNNCSSLAPNASCTASVTFSPTATGTRTGTLTFTDNATTSTQSVTLAGTSTGPQIIFSPSAIYFPGQPLETISSPITLTVSNTGTATLSISSITLSGAFTQSNNCSTPIVAGGSCQVTVNFIPTVYGTNLGTLLFTDNAAASPQSVTLSGNGEEALAYLSPSALTFSGTYVVGSQSAAQTIYYENLGNLPIVIGGILPSGDFTQSNNCEMVIAPSTYCIISVVFAPTAPGTRTGTLTLLDNTASSPHRLPLNGTAIASYPLPIVISLSAISLPVGGSGATLTVTGINFFPASSVLWDGQAIPSTYISSSSLTAAPPASVLTSGTHTVTVNNPQPGGGISNAISVTTYLVLPYVANDMVYDPYRRLYYVTLANTDTTAPDSVITVDPLTGNVATLIASASNPDRLALSDDGQFLYVGIDGSDSVERFNLYTNQSDLTIPLGSGTLGPYSALDIKVFPGAPHSIAVALGLTGTSPDQAGVAIFDDAHLRGAPPYQYASVMAFGANSTVLYGTSYGLSPPTLYMWSVGATGVTTVASEWNMGGGELHYLNGMLYSGGTVYNSNNMAQVANFGPLSGSYYINSNYPEQGTELVYFLAQTYTGGNFELAAASMSTYAVTGSVQIPQPSPYAAETTRVSRWGRDGLGALYNSDISASGYTTAGLYFVHSGITNPSTSNNPVPVISTLTPQTVFAGAANLQLTVNGSSFVPGAVVQWNGVDRTTAFVSSTQLTAYVSSADLAASGTAAITVINPTPAGGSSNGATLNIVSPATITSPTSGSTLTGTSTTFTWALNGATAPVYLHIGTTGPGSVDLVNIGPITGGSTTVSLPANGATIYVQLESQVSGVTVEQNYTYTEASQLAATITSPTGGSTLSGQSVTFTWTMNSSTAPVYLHVGTTVGGVDLVNIGPLSGTSTTVTLPTSGATIYVQLESQVNGRTVDIPYTYTEASQVAASITSPTNGSTLSGQNVTFTWVMNGSSAPVYLHVGTMVGGVDLVNIGPITGGSTTVTLPVLGNTIYVQLESQVNGVTVDIPYTYTEATQAAASITSPANGSTLSGQNVTFTWTLNGSAAPIYLHVGTMVGGVDLVNIGPLSGTSTTVTLPVLGATIYATLESQVNGKTVDIPYTYTEASQLPASITSPANGSQLGSTQTFTWAYNGSTDPVYLHIGSTPGGVDLVNIGPITGGSTTVNLPTDGATIYVTLESQVNGVSVDVPYTYIDPTTDSPSNNSRNPNATRGTGASQTVTTHKR